MVQMVGLGMRSSVEKNKMTRLAAERIVPASDTSISSSEASGQNLRQVVSGKTFTIALIDSRSLTREGLMRLLDRSERLNLIPVTSCSELFGKAPEVVSRVEIVLLNLGSAAIGDPEIVRDMALLNETLPKAAIIVICDREDGYHVGEALRRGVRGYIPTNLTSHILMGALRLVQSGGTFVPAGALTDALSQQPRALDGAAAEFGPLDLRGLTPRQRDVFDLLRQGKPNKVIAHELDMRESTVKVHVRQIMRKIGVSNRTEAAFLAANLAERKKA